MSDALRKHPGGIVLSVFLGSGKVRVGADQIESLRSNPQTDEWYAEVAEMCWHNAKAAAVDAVKRTLAYEIAKVPQVVDRRPSKIRSVRTETKEALQ